jgi:dethiobiotin synthetase
VSLFVTGTDTGVGKTYIATRLLRLLHASGVSCAGMKPICCGDRRDAALLLAAGSDGLSIEDINPVWLKTPAAPIVGSLIEKSDIHVEKIIAAFHALQNRVEQVIVEGVGGWLVPIRADYFISDLAMAMKLPVLAIASNRLGCLNHAALTVQSIFGHGLRCVGLVLNNAQDIDDIAARTNAGVLKEILDVPVLEGLRQNLTELPADWRLMLGSTIGS